MKDRAKTKALILNAVILSVAVVMMITLSFAWFSMQKDNDANHNINIGKFEVRLNDKNDNLVGSSVIMFPKAFPMTEAYAKNSANSLNNIYKFQVANVGDVDAMTRFVITVTDTNTKKFSQYLRYSIAYYDTTFTSWLPQAEVGKSYFLVDTAVNGLTNISLNEALDTLMIDANNTATTTGLISGGQSRWFEIIVWLDENATLEGTGADGMVTSVKLGMKMHAMQSGGGAVWAR